MLAMGACFWGNGALAHSPAAVRALSGCRTLRLRPSVPQHKALLRAGRRAPGLQAPLPMGGSARPTVHAAAKTPPLYNSSPALAAPQCGPDPWVQIRPRK